MSEELRKMTEDERKIALLLAKIKLNLERPGGTSGYNEGSSDYYNPIMAGKQIQKAEIALNELVDLLEYRSSSRGYGTTYTKKGCVR